MSLDNIQRDPYHTPRRVQKCLFGTDSPTKRDDLSDESNTEMGEMLPETPERQFGKELQNSVIETPCKNKEIILTTPLTSKQKINLLPRLYRRKSLNVLELIEGFSPDKKTNTLKRHAPEELEENTVKLFKTNENHSVSKARAALFQDKDYETKLKNITLSPKNFYNNVSEKKDYKILYKILESKFQKKSLTGHMRHYKKSTRRHTIGEINAGVSHGIKKPKPKSNVKKNSNSPENMKNTQVSMNEQLDLLKEMDTPNIISIPKTPSPEIDSNKRFFKTKSVSKENAAAIVTISNNIKLKFTSNDKVELSRKKSQRSKQVHKRAKSVDVSFDTTDLMEDEPELETTVEQNKIESILKILENDWADDDYDTMGSLINNNIINVSPLKPVAILKGITMSPASEITNMTSSMNIKDISTPKASKNVLMDNDNKKFHKNEPEHQYYPLFNKGYFANKVTNEIGNKLTNNTKGNKNWQLSAKLNGDENQYQLDAGQQNFGATQCTECGVVYQIGDPEDENAHLNYHNNRKILKFPGWKTEREIMEDTFTSSRIILLEPSDPKQYWKKVTDILAYVDRDLGLVGTKLSDYEQKRVYLYIRDKAVIGVLVAEHITTAYRMIPDLLDLDCCSAESSPVKCGINVIWTDMKHRKQGIATKLVDTLRSNFYFGYVMSLDDIAFSIPTPSGKRFAEKYTKTRNFKVYS